MAKKRPAPSRERLMQALRYDPDSGVFTWLLPTRGRIVCGTRAGYSEPDGRWWVRLDTVLYGANRLAWLYMTGEWPEIDVDHRDGDAGNDAWRNLRLATTAQNAANGPMRSTNTSGIKGVGFHKQTQLWRARVMLDGRERAAYFHTREAAAEAYAQMARDAFGEFARIG